MLKDSLSTDKENMASDAHLNYSIPVVPIDNKKCSPGSSYRVNNIASRAPKF